MATGRRLDDLEFLAWRAFFSTYATVVPKLDAELERDHGLSFNQFEVLTLLAQARKGLRMSDLASRVILSPSGVTRSVDQLERRGLVSRCVFEHDRRGQLATITAEGRTALRKATDSHVRGLRRHFVDHLSRAELRELADSLQAVLLGNGTPLRASGIDSGR
jgi:DNA-binding MarR family transcriptional regulator